MWRRTPAAAREARALEAAGDARLLGIPGAFRLAPLFLGGAHFLRALAWGAPWPTLSTPALLTGALTSTLCLRCRTTCSALVCSAGRPAPWARGAHTASPTLASASAHLLPLLPAQLWRPLQLPLRLRMGSLMPTQQAARHLLLQQRHQQAGTACRWICCRGSHRRWCCLKMLTGVSC